MKKILGIGLFLVLVFSVGPMACRWPISLTRQPEIISVLGRSDILPYKGLFETGRENYLYFLPVISAEGYGKWEADEEPAEARMLARVQARSQARRNLTEQILGLKISPTQTVQDFISQNEGVQHQLELLVNQAKIVAEQQVNGGPWQAKIEIEARQIADALGVAKQWEKEKEAATTLTRQQVLSLASRDAILDGQSRLLQYILNMEAGKNRTVREVLYRNPSLWPELKELLGQAQIKEVSYPEDKYCQAELEFNLSGVKKLVAKVE